MFSYLPASDAVNNTVFVETVASRTRQYSARSWPHPRTQEQRRWQDANRPGEAYPRPSYIVVDVGGEIDVVEHREYREQNREPTRALFWMVSDPAILAEARRRDVPGK